MIGVHHTDSTRLDVPSLPVVGSVVLTSINILIIIIGPTTILRMGIIVPTPQPIIVIEGRGDFGMIGIMIRWWGWQWSDGLGVDAMRIIVGRME